MTKSTKQKRGHGKKFKTKNIKLKPKETKKRYRDFKHTEQRRLLQRKKEERFKNNVESIDDNGTDDEQNDADTVAQLLCTFSSQHSILNNVAIDSDDSSDDDLENYHSINKAGEVPISSPEKIELETAKIDHDVQDDEENNTINDCNLSQSNDEDPYLQHFMGNLKPALLANLQAPPVLQVEHNINWPMLGCLKVTVPIERPCSNETATLLDAETFVKCGEPPREVRHSNWNDLHVKAQLAQNINNAWKQFSSTITFNDGLTELQKELFSILNNYQDLGYHMRTVDNGEEVRFAYCLHTLNHLLKSRDEVVGNNELLNKKENPDASDEFRDQGLVRPKVLMLVPFRDSCYRIVNMLSSLLFNNKKENVFNRARFNEEFTGSELFMPQKNRKPEDFEKLFAGNVDDSFRIGLSLTKKSLKLYSEFYSSDIIIASPLGIRMLIGAEGETERDFDFLASIEVLILDQTEVFLMQNWDHLLHIMNHLHMQPRESHGTDFTRVRLWALHGWARFYRQTIVLSSVLTPEMNALFSRHCSNYGGLVKIANSSAVSISQVLVPLPHVYRRFESAAPVEASEDRFRCFLEQVLPQLTDTSGVLVYVPSYFDFVRIRNYLKSKDYSFVQISEYSKDAKVARARDMFFHEEARILLYSERFHFFRRVTIKGISHLIFYQPPVFPHFYSEMCNLMVECNQNAATHDGTQSVTVLFSKYDYHSLSGIIRPSRAKHIISSDKSVFMFTTGETEN